MKNYFPPENSVSEDTDAKESVRAVLLSVIQKHPGIPQKSLSSGLSVNKSTVSYHLQELIKAKLISRIYIGRSAYCFPNAKDGIPIDTILELVLKAPQKRDVLNTMIFKAPINLTDLAEDMGRSPNSLKWHLDKLVILNLIRKCSRKGCVTYVVNPEVEPKLRDVFRTRNESGPGSTTILGTVPGYEMCSNYTR